MQEENENAPTATTDAPEQTAEMAAEMQETEPAATEEAVKTEETPATEETAPAAEPQVAAEPEPEEDITYQAVQKDGHVTAIWEMQGRKHLRTIDPRAREGQEILRLFTAEDHEHTEEATA